MKNIVLIAIIDSLGVYGCPMNTNNQEFDAYFRELTSDGIVAISGKTFECMRSKSPPFPCRSTYIVSAEECAIDPTLTRTNVVGSIDDLFVTITDTNQTVYIFLDESLNDLLSESYKQHCEDLIVGQIDEVFEGKELFPGIPPFDWQPLLVKHKPHRGKRSPGFTIHKYTSHTFGM
jgi:dihydrofolate reductase